MQIRGIPVEDTFAEAFPMRAARIIITAARPLLLDAAIAAMTGYGTSVIGCDAEVALEKTLKAEQTPDGRLGAAILAFAFDRKSLEKAVLNRVGQTVMTCATTACYNGLPIDKKSEIKVGGGLRYYGDGQQIAKKLGATRYWRVPVMDGEFLCEDRFGVVTGVAGGNILMTGADSGLVLDAALAAAEAAKTVPEVILPFPAGVVRSGSQVGSKYPKLRASTNLGWCPTLAHLPQSRLLEGERCVYELVMDGLTLEGVAESMRRAIDAASRFAISRITAGNYGGKLGPHHIHLRELLPKGEPSC